jgi:hypothetical protein
MCEWSRLGHVPSAISDLVSENITFHFTSCVVPQFTLFVLVLFTLKRFDRCINLKIAFFLHSMLHPTRLLQVPHQVLILALNANDGELKQEIP